MAEEAGSYDFGTFEENQAELERLQRQAIIAAKIEIKALERLGVGSGMDVMDLACGPGLISCEIARLVSPGSVLGVDLNPKLIEVAKDAAAKQEMTNTEFIIGNVYDENITDRQFDWVYARFLFQHLENPLPALKNAMQYLKPGGKICIIDVDDQWLTIHPDPGVFSSFTKRAAVGQASNKGDRHVGRKFKSLLKEAGYADPSIFIQPVTSDDIGMENFVGLTTGFKLEQIPEKEKEIAEQELKGIYELAKDPDTWGAVGIFGGLGTRP